MLETFFDLFQGLGKLSVQQFMRDSAHRLFPGVAIQFLKSTAPDLNPALRVSYHDLGKFEDGYEVALKQLVEAKVNNLPIPKDEVPAASSGKVINLMDALRKSVANDPKTKKPVASEKDARKGIGLVKPSAKAAKRKSA